MSWERMGRMLLLLTWRDVWWWGRDDVVCCLSKMFCEWHVQLGAGGGLKKKRRREET